ncbi:MAG: hypothetical protein Q4C63_05095 [Eubacteriales bacterium]|nr:hypothetical protein [Eubacteriales bacterium]
MSLIGITYTERVPTTGIPEMEVLRARYLESLRNCRERGIRVLIDGREEPEHIWPKLFCSEDAGFYMADYVTETEGLVKEIRFDKIYMKDF